MDTKQILRHLNLLLLDDSRHNAAEIYSIFSNIFNSITLAHDVESAIRLLATNPIDIIITDIRMPGVDGLSFADDVRSTNTTIPIIILSAHTDKEYLLRAANLQIDGYITKPLNFSKLNSALARAVTRLTHRVQAIDISDTITFHPLLKTLYVDGEEVSLGNKEYLLLHLLVGNMHRVINKQEIHATVWPDEVVSESALKNLMGELRKKLKYNVILNRHGQGWILTQENP